MLSEKEIEFKNELIKQLRPIDDFMFEMLMKDKDVAEEILRVLMDDEKLVVEHLVPQNSIKNLQGKSVRLDALCTLKDGRLCNVDVQKGNYENHSRRVRYYASCITANALDVGKDYNDVPDVCVIYICEVDVFGKNQMMYRCQMNDMEFHEPVNDGLTEIFINAKVPDDSRIGNLMRQFESKDVIEQENFPELQRRLHEIKNDKEEEESMCELLEKFTEEVMNKGRAEGLAEERLNTITRMQAAGFSLDQITMLGYSDSEIKMAAEA